MPNSGFLLTSLAWAVRIACMLVVLYAIADTVWFFAVGPTNAGQELQVDSNPTAHQRNVDTSRIVAADLFGVAAKEEIAPAFEDLQETTLNLTLEGTFIATDENTASVALISHRDRNSGTQEYLIGDAVGTLAEIAEIHPRFIVISRGGEHERLTFAVKRAFSQAPDSYPRTVPSYGPGAMATGTIESKKPDFERVRNASIDDLASLGLTEVDAGGETLLRIQNQSTPSPLMRLGMQPGDFVVSVNGHSLTALRQNEGLAEEIFSGGMAKLEVRRGNRLFILTVPTHQ